MTVQDRKHRVMGQPGRSRPATSNAAPGQAPDGRELRGDGEGLTWWDLMSDLDPGWLAWSDRPDESEEANRRVA